MILIRILFICHGNICRSPMAEMIMKDMVRQKGLAAKFEISSMAATTEEMGHDIYPPAKRALDAHHIPYTKRKASLITERDYRWADYIIAMDEENMYDLSRLTQGDPEKKSPAFLTGREKQGMWRTPGIREILRKPMRI
jgi:protein-tyrosine phosphatase